MELRQLRYFLKVADLGSISKAADHLFIAQSAVSQQVAALEYSLDAKLFTRRSSGVVLTEAGRLLYRHAQTISRQLQLAADDVRAASTSPSGPVSVGLPTAVVHLLGMRLIEAVRSRHPRIALHMVDGVSALLQEFVLNGRLDIAVLFLDESVKGLEVLPLLDEVVYYIAPAAAPWALALGDSVTLEETSRLPLVVPAEGNNIRFLLGRAFAQAGLRLSPLAVLDSFELLKESVVVGLAGVFLPAAAVAAEADAGKVRVLPVRDGQFNRPVSICTFDSEALSLAAAAVHAILKELTQQLAGSGDWRGATIRPAVI